MLKKKLTTFCQPTTKLELTLTILELKVVRAATPILYHLTSTNAAVAILTKNRFELKPSEGTERESELLSRKEAYYLSTTRSKLGSYSLKGVGTHSTIFVLDGTKLSSRYKIKPVDYWGPTFQSTPANRTASDEAEDRILSNKPLLPAIPYVKEVHAHIGDGGKASNRAVALKKICLLKKIPVFFYNDAKALLLMDKKKAVPLSVKDKFQEDAPWVDSYEVKKARYAEQGQNALMGWIEIATYPVSPDKTADELYLIAKAKLSRYGLMAYTLLGSVGYNQDAVRSLSADLHNYKSMPYGRISEDRESLDKLVALLRKRNETIGQFVKALYLKWYPRREW